jgi:secondary thiamine-phosphate synthase enzyme
MKAPIAIVTLVDDTHLHAKSCAGSRDLEAKAGRTPVHETFCRHVVGAAEPLIVPDARQNELTRGMAVVKSGKALAYLGVPLELELRAALDARKQAEADLARLRRVLDHSPALVYAKDLAGGSVFANRAALQAPPTRSLGALGEADVAVIAGGSPVEADETLELDGGAFVHRTVRFPMTDAAGEPCGVCACPSRSALWRRRRHRSPPTPGSTTPPRRCCAGSRPRSTRPGPRSPPALARARTLWGLMWLQREISLRPPGRGFHLVTRDVVGELPELGELRVGLLHLFMLHTSASLTLNENASPDVRRDFEAYFNAAVPENADYWTHTDEGPDDMPAHIKASVLGPSLSLPVANGRLALGTWQGIYLCEHRDRPSGRRVLATLWGEE